MGELQVARWRRYGKDRLYINDAAGERVGWVDLQSGGHQLERPELAADFKATVESYCAFNGLRVSGLLAEAVPVPAPRPGTEARPIISETRVTPDSSTAADGPVEKPWHDLALNVAGQAARAQAELELAAMRDHSRVGSFLARAFDMKTDERSWRIGADGEETVGAKLEKLRSHGWGVLHAVPVGDRGSDIDHVLIGPGGVWTLNTKTHPGKHVWVGRHQVRVDGHRTNYLRNSRFEADRAADLLTKACGFPVEVKAALVFLTGSLSPNVTIKQQPDQVVVLDRMDIPRAFRRARRRLSDDQIEIIFGHARRSTTWCQ